MLTRFLGLAAALSASLAQPSIAAPGGLDPSFDYNGIVRLGFSHGSLTTLDGKVIASRSIAVGTSTAIQADGRILVAGFVDDLHIRFGEMGPVTVKSDPYNFAVARFLPTGELDSSFGVGGKVITELSPDEDSPSKVFVVEGGKILLVGISDNRIALVRYLSDGSLDLTFGAGGRSFAPLGAYRGDPRMPAAIQADGRIIVAATISWSWPTETRPVLVFRFNADGTLDPSFGGGSGQVTVGRILWQNQGADAARDLAVLSDGKILIAGTRRYDGALTRLNADGSYDLTFGEEGYLKLPGLVYSVAVLAGGEYLVGTSVADPSGAQQRDVQLFRVSPYGAIDATFGTGGSVTFTTGSAEMETYDYPLMIRQMNGGDFLVLSLVVRQDGTHVPTLTRHSADGSLDTSFGAGGFVRQKFPLWSSFGVTAQPHVEASDFLIQPDGRIVTAGHYSGVTGTEFQLFRYLIDDSVSSAEFSPEVDLEVTSAEYLATSQVRTAGSRERGRPLRRLTATGIVRNFGTNFDRFRLEGTRSNRAFDIQYFEGQSKITREVEKRQFQTAALSPEEIASITVVVRPKRTVRKAVRPLRLSLTAISSGDGTVRRVAALTVRARR